MQSELKLIDQLLYSTVTNITHSNRDVSKGKQEEVSFLVEPMKRFLDLNSGTENEEMQRATETLGKDPFVSF